VQKYPEISLFAKLVLHTVAIVFYKVADVFWVATTCRLVGRYRRFG
jgi:hypothetical protein